MITEKVVQRIMKVWRPDYFAAHEGIVSDLNEIEEVITNGGKNCRLELREDFGGPEKRSTFCLDPQTE